MKIPTYHMDAFAGSVFSGNPAMVCALDEWLDDDRLQSIATENHLPATAFLVGTGDVYGLRWFTPTTELELCGHGTLAASAVVFDHLDPGRVSVRFETRGGSLCVSKEGSLVRMDFPVRVPVPCTDVPAILVEALGVEPRAVLRASHYLVVYGSEDDIRDITPDIAMLCEADCHGVIISAPGERADFVSRYFAPRFGIPEDAATGSTHCMLAPYWSERLGSRRLHALQLSRRGGELWCERLADAVRIEAHVSRYAQGSLYL